MHTYLCIYIFTYTHVSSYLKRNDRSELTQSSFRSHPVVGYDHNGGSGARSRTRSSSAGPASKMAQRMVMDLGVQNNEEAEVAMSVIDRLSALTDSQINAMDPDTKLQVITI